MDNYPSADHSFQPDALHGYIKRVMGTETSDKNGTLNNQSKKAFVKYGKHTFKLTSKTKYCYYEEGGKRYSTKAHFMSTVKRLNGLGLWIKVTNGKVVEMSFHS